MFSDAKKRAVIRLRKKGLGYKKIGASFKLSRDQVRGYLRTDAAKRAVRNSKKK